MLLYIHIPFCDSKCSYCAFNTYVDKFHLKALYMQALHKQLSFELLRFGATANSIESVFFGGGTPSTIDPQLYAPIFELITPYLQRECEITTEANPNSATQEWLKEMFALGVNRVSFGVQSFNAQKLKILNRAHDPKAAINAVENAAKVGFTNISLDLIYATLGDTKKLLQHDLDTAFSLPINHLSAYALTIEEGTAFEKKKEMSSEELSLTEWIFASIEAKGFKQYEISNFGSYQSTHNIGYWRYADYIGAGAGGVGKKDLSRFYPTPNLEEYIENPLQIREELLSHEDVKFEKIFLGLRSFVGVSESLLNQSELEAAHILLQENRLSFSDETFYNQNFLLADEIALYLSGY